MCGRAGWLVPRKATHSPKAGTESTGFQDQPTEPEAGIGWERSRVGKFEMYLCEARGAVELDKENRCSGQGEWKEGGRKKRGALFGLRILLVFRRKAGLAPGEDPGLIHRVEVSRSLRREFMVEVSSGGEGVEAAAKHALGVMVGYGTNLDTEVG